MKRTSFHSGWLYDGQPVTLPHDAMLAAARRADAPSGGGCAYFEGGVYRYQKTFTAPTAWQGKHILLQFEGVYRKSTVTLNGKPVGGAAYGYRPFFVVLDDALQYGAENTVEVVADNSAQPNSRWYSGGGIYRPVWLWVCEPGGLTPECVRVTTLSYKPAKIRVDAPAGAAVELWDGAEKVAAGQPGEFEISDAKLWSAETPRLYTCRVALGEDRTEVQFGIRTLEWSNKGFFVNGRETLLRGGCIHHDNGILGAATYTEAEWRRVKKLKAAGYNALRISHNPASTALLDACDHYGLYVMDEMWDMWYNRKNREDYALDFPANYQSDIAAVVQRDYSHPCVVLYSIGNEVSEPAQAKGVALAKELVAEFHRLDPTRPVTGGMNLMIISRAAKGNAVYKEDGGRDESNEKSMSGMNSLMFNMITNLVGSGMNKGANSKKADAVTTPVLDALDIAGYNYASGRYPLEGKAHPDRVIFGSETFPQDLAKNWAMVKQYPYLIGDFMWTAWDYLGEAGGGAWAYTPDGRGFQKPYPWLLADMGAMDILGDPNGELFWAQAIWGLLDAPKLAVQPVNHPGVTPAKSSWRGTNALPIWSWQGCEGNRATVEVYFDCAKIELYLNGEKLGSQRVKGCRAVFKTHYRPGKLEAVAYAADGRELGRGTLSTAQSAGLQVCAERSAAESGALVYCPVTIGDGQRVEGNADRAVTVTVEGGELLAFGSANPRTEERFHSGTYTTYYGRALAVVRAGESSQLTVTVKDAKGSARVTLPVTAKEEYA